MADLPPGYNQVQGQPPYQGGAPPPDQDGSGRRTCLRCHGRGMITCPHCQGHCRVINYIELTVSYVNHISDYILEETDMPDHLVRDVQGVQIFEQTMPAVYPLVGFPVQVINDNSVRLVEAHRNSFRSELQLNQRHSLRAVPVTEVQYKFKDFESKFWVYGNERSVWSPDYPQQCCWGCNIL